MFKVSILFFTLLLSFQISFSQIIINEIVSCLVNADHESGTYSTSISWAELDNGVYYCVMEYLEGLTTKKLVYVK